MAAGNVPSYFFRWNRLENGRIISRNRRTADPDAYFAAQPDAHADAHPASHSHTTSLGDALANTNIGEVILLLIFVPCQGDPGAQPGVVKQERQVGLQGCVLGQFREAG